MNYESLKREYSLFSVEWQITSEAPTSTVPCGFGIMFNPRQFASSVQVEVKSGQFLNTSYFFLPFLSNINVSRHCLCLCLSINICTNLVKDFIFWKALWNTKQIHSLQFPFFYLYSHNSHIHQIFTILNMAATNF